MSISEILFGLFFVAMSSVLLMSSIVMFVFIWEDLKDTKRRKK